MFNIFIKVKALLGNKDNRVLANNIFSLSVLQIATYFIPLITLPYLIRVLGSEKFGLVSFATAYTMYFVSFVEYSFPLKATREIALNNSNYYVISEIFCRVILTKLFLFLVGGLITIGVVFSIPNFRNDFDLFLFSYLLVLGFIFYPFWFFQGIEKMKFITINNLIVKTLSVILIFVIVKDKKDYIYVPIINSLSYCIGGIYSIYIIFKRFNIKLIKIKFSQIITELKEGWAIFTIRFVPNLYNNSNIFLLGLLTSNRETAFFDAGKRIIDAVQSFNDVFSRSFFPFLNRKSEKFVKAKYYILGVGLLLSIMVMVFAYPIYLIIYTHEFLPSLFVILILGFSPFFISLDSTFGANGLLRIGKEKVYMKVVITLAIIGFFSGILLISLFSFIGAAINLLLIRALIGLVLFIYYKKYES